MRVNLSRQTETSQAFNSHHAQRGQGHLAGLFVHGLDMNQGLRERAYLVGGTMDIDASPGRGTTVLVRIPLSANRDGEARRPGDAQTTGR